MYDVWWLKEKNRYWILSKINQCNLNEFPDNFCRNCPLNYKIYMENHQDSKSNLKKNYKLGNTDHQIKKFAINKDIFSKTKLREFKAVCFWKRKDKYQRNIIQSPEIHWPIQIYYFWEWVQINLKGQWMIFWTKGAVIIGLSHVKRNISLYHLRYKINLKK